jgi:hypothetical protein
MAIDETFLERIVAFGTEQGVFPGGSVAILGDCRFITAWASGDNRRDLAEFQRRHSLARAETLDIAGRPTITLDLHAPLPQSLRGQFDMVIDAGTMHCCFDVARVLENILLLAKERAAILHVSAFVGFTGRCFYKIDPSMFRDFYNQNGFSRIGLWVKAGTANSLGVRAWRKLRRLVGMPVAPLQALSSDAMMIEAASAFSFRFASHPKAAPATLPNDAIVICAAWRDKAEPFKRPVPSFFGG